MMRHIFIIAAIAIAAALGYIVVVCTAPKDISSAIGIGYIIIITTVTFIWEIIHRRPH